MGKIFDPEVVTLNDLLRNNIFQVPVYQRPYSWGNDELKDLYSDIENSYKTYNPNSSNFSGLFLGTLYLKDEGRKNAQTTYHIIDGQQRITTITIFLLVAHSIMIERQLTGKPLDEVKNCLWRYDSSLRALKKDARVLTLGSLDKKTMEDLFDTAFGSGSLKSVNTVDKSSGKNILEATVFFFKQLEKVNDTELLNLVDFMLCGVQVVTIMVSSPLKKIFEIFEAINSKGKKLDNIDLIKSYIFQLVPEDDHPEYLRKWGDLIEKTNDKLEDYLYVYIKAFVKFYRTSLSVKYFRALSADGLPKKFNCKNSEQAVKNLINDMLKKVDFFVMLSDVNKLPKPFSSSNKFLFFYNCLNYLGYQHPKPLLFKALCQYNENNNGISDSDIKKIFRYSLAFMFSYQTINNRDSKDAIEVFEDILNSDYAVNKLDVIKIKKIFDNKLAVEGINKPALQKKLEDYKGYAKSDKSETRVLLAFFESISGNKVLYDNANIILSNSQAYSIDHILSRNPDQNDNFYYYPVKHTSGETVLQLKPGADFPDYISNGMDYEIFKDQILHKLGNLRIISQSSNSSKGNNQVIIGKYSFNTFTDVTNRSREIADKLYDSELLTIK